VPLAEVPAGRRVTLVEVPDGDPALLRYLGELDLRPGATVEVRAAAPFGGPLTLGLPSGEAVLGRDLASRLLVSAAPSDQETIHAS
jgi:Fe2+ transport system protein FeoA